MRSHHCPAVLFGIYANPQTDDARNEQLWALRRGGDSEPVLLRASQIGVEKRIYSESDSGPAELYFQEYEKDLKTHVRRGLRQSLGPPSKQRSLAGALLLQHANVLYARNAVHRLEASADRFELFKNASERLDREVLRGWRPHESEDEFLARTNQLSTADVERLDVGSRSRLALTAKAAFSRWQWEVLPTSGRVPLITCDTPARPFELQGEASAWIWPLTADRLFVATTSPWEIRSRRLTDGEVAIVNGLMTNLAHRWALSSKPFPVDVAQSIVAGWRQATHVPPSVFTDTEWRNPMLSMTSPSHRLPFLQRKLDFG